MKIGILRKPTKVLDNFCYHFCNGLNKHNQKYKLFNVKEKYDLIVSFTFNNKAQQIIQSQKQCNGLFLTIKSPLFDESGIVDFFNREKKTSPQNDPKSIYIFADLLDRDYQTHFYIRNQPNDRLRKFNIKLKTQHENGDYILIPEQFRPEGLGHNIKDRKSWKKWFIRTCKIIQTHTKLPILVKLHPGRPRWGRLGEDLSLDIFNDIIVSDSIDDLSLTQSLITVSSKLAFQAVMEGVSIYTLNPNCLSFPMSQKSIVDTVNSPRSMDRQQWLNDIAYSHWSLYELSQGDYWEYFTTCLLNDR